jgi:hypothetical protein
MLLTRRFVLGGVIAAPAVVAAAPIMPVSAKMLLQPDGWMFDGGAVTGGLRQIVLGPAIKPGRLITIVNAGRAPLLISGSRDERIIPGGAAQFVATDIGWMSVS